MEMEVHQWVRSPSGWDKNCGDIVHGIDLLVSWWVAHGTRHRSSQRSVRWKLSVIGKYRRQNGSAEVGVAERAGRNAILAEPRLCTHRYTRTHCHSHSHVIEVVYERLLGWWGVGATSAVAGKLVLERRKREMGQLSGRRGRHCRSAIIIIIIKGEYHQ